MEKGTRGARLQRWSTAARSGEGFGIVGTFTAFSIRRPEPGLGVVKIEPRSFALLHSG